MQLCIVNAKQEHK